MIRPRPFRDSERPSVWQVTWRMITIQPRVFGAFAAGFLLIQGARLLPGPVEKWIFDELTGVWTPSVGVGTLIALLAGMAALRAAVQVIHGWSHATFYYRGGVFLRRNIFGSVLRRPGAQAGAVSPGDALSRLRHDAGEVADFPLWIPYVASHVAVTVVAVGVMMRINALITLAVVTPSVGLMALSRLAWGRILSYRRASRAATGAVTAFVAEIMGSALTIKAVSGQINMISRLEELGEIRRRTAVRDHFFRAFLESVYGLALDLGVGLTLLMAGAAMARGAFTVGDFALFVSYLLPVTQVPALVGTFLGDYRQQSVSLERMEEMVRPEPASLLLEGQPMKGPGCPSPRRTPPVSPGRDQLQTLEARELSFRPEGGGGIRGVSLVLRRGSLTVITGKVGAGKTTLLRLLLGLLPRDQGEILWNGRVVGSPGAFMVPPRVGYTPQVPRLFSGTIGENIVLGRSGAGGESPEADELRAAVHTAAMAEDLAAMARGLDTVIGARGVRLSGGQIHRVAAARMLFVQPELLVVDDLSSALDVETERVLWDRVLSSPGSTCLAVSHRPWILERADNIIVLRGGRAIAQGSLGGLLEDCREIRDLFDAGK